MNMQIWRFAKFDSLPSGPWYGEPDKAQWIDQPSGFDCLIVRNQYGALCGYVGLPPGHPWHGLDYGDVDGGVHVHGGLTFAGPCDEESRTEGICHIPEPGRPDNVWWLGFDCGHIGDEMPLGYDLPDHLAVYRTFDWVKAQCAHLAEQLAAPLVAS